MGDGAGKERCHFDEAESKVGLRLTDTATVETAIEAEAAEDTDGTVGAKVQCSSK